MSAALHASAAKHPELAVELSLIDPTTLDADRAHQLAALACKAADIHRCDDDASPARVAAVLAEECRGGARDQCFAAAEATSDPRDKAALAGIACKAGEGRACAIVEDWRGACADDGFDVGDDELAARDDACRRW